MRPDEAPRQEGLTVAISEISVETVIEKTLAKLWMTPMQKDGLPPKAPAAVHAAQSDHPSQ